MYSLTWRAATPSLRVIVSVVRALISPRCSFNSSSSLCLSWTSFWITSSLCRQYRGTFNEWISMKLAYQIKEVMRQYVNATCHTCLRSCTKRPRVETKATENPVRPCFACVLWLFGADSVSWTTVSNSASTWLNMSCSSWRLLWSPLRDETDEPVNSELWETRVLLILRGSPWIFPEKYMQI